VRPLASAPAERGKSSPKIEVAVSRLVAVTPIANSCLGFINKETSVDGGKVRIREPKGKGCHWLNYKAVRFHDSFYAGYFLENEVLIDYVNR